MGRQVRFQIRHQNSQSIGISRRQGNQHLGSLSRGNWARGLVLGIRHRFQEQVGINSTCAKGTHARPPHAGHGNPGRKLSLHPKTHLRKGDRGIGRIRMERRNQLPMLHLQQHLDQARNARSGFQMANIGLHGTDRAGVGSVAPQHTAEGRHLHRIAQFRTRAMGLDVADGFGSKPRLIQRLGNRRRLGHRVGHGVAMGASPVGDAGTLNNAVDSIAIRSRLGQRLQNHRPNPFAGPITITSGSKAVAAAIPGGKLLLAHGHKLGRVQIKIHASRQGQVAFPAPDGFTGQMHRHQGRRASRVHGQARAVPIQHMGNTIGHAPVGRASGNHPPLGPSFCGQ